MQAANDIQISEQSGSPAFSRRHLDLCSGFGGFALAAQWTGWETIGFSEVNEYANSVLRKHWPDVPNYGDIRAIPVIGCDLITAGFPCQPYSVNGKRRGASDDRDLWPAVLGVIRKCRPSWVLAENVTNIANMVLDRCLDDLEESGYRAKALDIPACAVGLPSMERHIWIIASRVDDGPQGSAEESIPVEQLPKLFRWEICAGAPWLDGRPDLSEPKLLRSRKGFPNFVERIHGLGNAIPPPVAAVIMDAMARYTTLTQ